MSEQQGKDRIAQLQSMSKNVRTGGKGTQRRKKKVQRKAGNSDDKKIMQTLKGLGLNPVPNIDEVELFKDDGNVVVLKNPKMHAATGSNTFLVFGNPEVKKYSDVVSEAELLAAVKAAVGGAADDDDIPGLVSGVNFESVAKETPAAETPAEAPAEAPADAQ